MNEPSAITLVFPHQLFEAGAALDPGREVWLIEDTLFFADPHTGLRFHRKKLVLHRASMRAYRDELGARGFRVRYFDFEPGLTIDRRLTRDLPDSVAELHVFDPVDYLLERRLKRFARTTGIRLRIHPTPMFLTDPAWFNPWFDRRKSYFMADFYKEQRKRLHVLVDEDGKPLGGRWSFDADNRRKWPAGRTPPPAYIPPAGSYAADAARHVDAVFPDHPGTTAGFAYPVTRAQASDALDHFLEYRFRGFGDYEDAITRRHAVLHHSVLTPALNTGLITPRAVLDRALAFAAERSIPLNDLEGFVRQIIGWREFMRIIYVREGTRQRTSNFWDHRRALDRRWYEGTTGLDPLDHVIRRVNETAYCHHIERLMVAGGAMLLARIRPDDVYRWFMELFIDAYDWVMVPNVYGMSQFADGGLITTKPYMSGSNYIRKMSDWGTGAWCGTWDGLYWRFIADHAGFFSANPRLSMMTRQLDKMDPERRKRLFAAADAFSETSL